MKAAVKRRAWLLGVALILGCSLPAGAREADQTARTVVGHMPLDHATQFSVDYYDDGSALLTIAGTDRYYILPREDAGEEAAALPQGTAGEETAALPQGTAGEETAALPQGTAGEEAAAVPQGDEGETEALASIQDLPEGAIWLRQGAKAIYLASSSGADFFLQLGALDHIALSSTNGQSWRLPEMRAALENGDIRYAGKYSAPDYELVLRTGTDLVIENTMIFHSPATKEKLEKLGLPVLVEYSSYENDPLGRLEWIKMYGLLLGKQEEAEQFFASQVQKIEALKAVPAKEQTVAFFHVNSQGAFVVRSSSDYVARMIEMAGGRYVPQLKETEGKTVSTLNMQREAFYTAAVNADVLIYNCTIDQELFTIEQLLEKDPLLRDFKAVREGRVFCNEPSMFQQTSGTAGMIADLNAILNGEEEALSYFHSLK